MKGQDNPLISNPHPHSLNSLIKKPIIVPSSYPPKKTHKPRKAIRTTEISQSSGPINLVADETVYKEWEDRMERAANTASSLDAELDSDAQTRFETTFKQSNDPPLSRGYTLRSGEDNMKLLELMELCIKLSDLFWATAKINTVNRERQLQALVDKKQVIIMETSIRSDLHLEDAGGIDCLPTATIFEELTRMGHSYCFSTATITIQPSTSKPQKKQSRRKQKKTTAAPHPSNSTVDVLNEEFVPTHSNDPLLSGEDILKLNDLMDMCTKLSESVLDLEHTKTAQAQEITNLKLRVKKLEKKTSLGGQEDASNKGRSIQDIDKDAEVSLVDETQGRLDDAEMFDTTALIGNEVFAKNDMIEKDQDVIPTIDPKDKELAQRLHEEELAELDRAQKERQNQEEATKPSEEPDAEEAHDPDYVPEPIYPEYIQLEDDHEFPAEEQPLPPIDSPNAESPGYVIESDPEEDLEEYEDDEINDGPVDYHMDGGDDEDDDDGDSSGDDADEDEDDRTRMHDEEEPINSDRLYYCAPDDESLFPPRKRGNRACYTTTLY
ncbi:hypothetical protein Tco_1082727 [Tanacetum coccineum]|uniref:Uncharacterized protein n=1 Tax=Tanacetum coccineum TaxID=301880 RepID=A0ABQ5I2W6_9ASTR